MFLSGQWSGTLAAFLPCLPVSLGPSVTVTENCQRDEGSGLESLFLATCLKWIMLLESYSPFMAGLIPLLIKIVLAQYEIIAHKIKTLFGLCVFYGLCSDQVGLGLLWFGIALVKMTTCLGSCLVK